MFNIVVNDLVLPITKASSGLEIIQDLKLSPYDFVAITVNGKIYDLPSTLNRSFHSVTSSDHIELVSRNSKVGLDIIRHSCAHILAHALHDVYDGIQLAIGPVNEDGFFYDFSSPTTIRLDDLAAIEKRMHEIVDEKLPIRRMELSLAKAKEFFTDHPFKQELLTDLEISNPNEIISIYAHYPQNYAKDPQTPAIFNDLCKGPHVLNTGIVGKGFKLTKVSGSYWRGDSKKQPLQRIYGIAFADNNDLQAHLTFLEEAEKRDHRKIGKNMHLFHLQPELAAGSVFWHPRGVVLLELIINYMKQKWKDNGYQEVRSPILLNKNLWEASGHWDKFYEHMFITNSEDRELAIKPMNCPGHVQIFKHGTKSYRELPLRLAEFGICHRNEASGSLHGLLRLRSFMQDDAHIFCTISQIIDETKRFCNLLKEVYADFGFHEVIVKFSDRPQERVGEDALWDIAEKSLHEAAAACNLKLGYNKGEGAFYGPKLEFVLKDALNREWQCGTLQVDFNLAVRLDAKYVNENGAKEHPVLLHRAILGAIERFVGVLLEHGDLPLWLCPVQIAIIPVSDKFSQYAQYIYSMLNNNDWRVLVDQRKEQVNYKIRDLTPQKIPIFIIVGQTEEEENTVSLRLRSGDKCLVSANDLLSFLATLNINSRASSPPNAFTSASSSSSSLFNTSLNSNLNAHTNAKSTSNI